MSVVLLLGLIVAVFVTLRHGVKIEVGRGNLLGEYSRRAD